MKEGDVGAQSISVVAERISHERELRLALEKRLDARIDFLDKFSKSITDAAKEAVSKAESAQKAVNERQNEFRGQLSDQAATLMPRKECEASIASVREIIEREMKLVRIDIGSLRESRSVVVGKDAGKNTTWSHIALLVGWALTIALAMFAAKK